MQAARVRALATLAIAALAAGCGPGEHSQRAQLSRIFGGGAAGKGAAGAAPMDPADPPAPNEPRVSPRAGTGANTAGKSSQGGAGAPAVTPPSSAPNEQAGATGAPQAGSGGRMSPAAPNSTAGAAGLTEVASAGTSGTTAPSVPTSCEPGYLSVAGSCVCDLNGTFAFHGSAPVTMGSAPPLEALNDTIDVWGIVRHVYDESGALTVTLAPCGQTNPDMCAAAQAPVLPSPEAYAQYVPVGVWDMAPTMTSVELALPDASPGAAFVTSSLAQLFGVSLANPLGAWPASRKDIEGGSEFDGSSVNGARWVDMDRDGKLGMTIKVVRPGGVAAAATSGPPLSYAAQSTKCPRSNAQAARSPYAYLPFPQGLGVKRITGLYSAQRMLLEFHGALESCDRISGMLTGPDGAGLKLDALIGGCSMVNGSSESDCGASLLDTAESGGGNATLRLQLGVGSFVMQRVTDETTCADVRALQLN